MSKKPPQPPTPETPLSRREREIMDIVFRHGLATAAEVRGAMASAPTDAAVRATLRNLVEKGHLKHEHDGPRYVYSPTLPRETARKSALRHMLKTFFGGSTHGAMAALLDEAGNLTDEERERLKTMVDKAAAEGR